MAQRIVMDGPSQIKTWRVDGTRMIDVDGRTVGWLQPVAGRWIIRLFTYTRRSVILGPPHRTQRDAIRTLQEWIANRGIDE